MSQSNGNVTGVLELMGNGPGYLRDPAKNYAVNAVNPQVQRDVIRSFKLRGGEHIEGVRGRSKSSGKPMVQRIERICGRDAREYGDVTPFDQLDVVHPSEQIIFETEGGPMSMRVVDLFAPIGKGQRALIVAPPRTGKTVLLQNMADGIRKNHPESLLMVLLVDERPEEVTEIRRAVCDKGSGWHNDEPEVLYSSNDHDAKNHARMTRFAIDKAKRYVEQGRDAIILMDSLTRLSRAHNNLVGSSGRTMSGGLDIRAMEVPKQSFGAARKFENGGSLTIIASVLIETGSRMDEFIFQEFKGTGNMELVLSRELANQRIYPACNLSESGTRKEEILLGQEVYDKVSRVRRRLLSSSPTRQMETMLADLAKFPNNETYLKHLA